MRALCSHLGDGAVLAHLDEDGAAVGAAFLRAAAFGRRGLFLGAPRQHRLHHRLERRDGARPHGRADGRVAPLAAPPVDLPVRPVLHDQRPEEVRLPHAGGKKAITELVLVQGPAAVVLGPVPALEAHGLVDVEVTPPARAPDQVEGERLGRRGFDWGKKRKEEEDEEDVM